MSTLKTVTFYNGDFVIDTEKHDYTVRVVEPLITEHPVNGMKIVEEDEQLILMTVTDMGNKPYAAVRGTDGKILHTFPENLKFEKTNHNIQRDEEAVSSFSDERTVNNVMRHEYKVLTDDEKESMQTVKDMGLEFHEYLNKLGNSRELSLAKTKIEEAVMWAVKDITG